MVRLNIELPDEVHETTKAAASLEGEKLEQYVVDVLRSESESVLRNRVENNKEDGGF